MCQACTISQRFAVMCFIILLLIIASVTICIVKRLPWEQESESDKITMELTSAISLVCAAQKSEKFKMPLLSKNIWKPVDEYLSVQTKPKLIAMHRNFGQFSRKYKNVSGEIKEKLQSTEINWLFFEESETEKIIAENVDKIDGFK